MGKKTIRTICPKNQENLRIANLGSNFTGTYKKSVPQQEEGNHYSVIKEVLYQSGDATCFFFFSEWESFCLLSK